MGRNSHYFKDRVTRQEHARIVTKNNKEKLSEFIEYSVAHRYYLWAYDSPIGSIYDESHPSRPRSEVFDTGWYVEDTDTVTALYEMDDILNRGESHEKPCILNFASFKNPGGMFLEGSGAQEECICHESTLYNTLSDPQILKEYYSYNRLHIHTNAHLYESNSLITPNILFYRNIGGETAIRYADVLTCAAPNAYAAHEYATITYKAIRKALIERIFTVLFHMYLNSNDVLILGAYGCGVFGNDPFEVAYIFNTLLETIFKNQFSAVIFAVPKTSNEENYRAFNKVIGNREYTGSLDEIDFYKKKYYEKEQHND